MVTLLDSTTRGIVRCGLKLARQNLRAAERCTGGLSLTNSWAIVRYTEIHFLPFPAHIHKSYNSDNQAVSDFPCIAFSEELINAYPGAKVILTLRDVHSWHRHVSN